MAKKQKSVKTKKPMKKVSKRKMNRMMSDCM